MPSGVWSPEEYAKLPPYDGETFEQPPALFMCHQADGHLCSGWLACHGAGDLLAVRFGLIGGTVAESALDYETDVPLFASGAEAAEHGLAELDAPSEAAVAVMEKVIRVREARGRPVHLDDECEVHGIRRCTICL